MNATPPASIAAVATGVVAMVVGNGAAVVTGTAEPDWASPAKLGRNVIPHLAFGAMTSIALHRMLDPHTTVAHR